ncbi:MAG: hypothetical protein QOG87_353 [Actinomycetota bacterium]
MTRPDVRGAARRLVSGLSLAAWLYVSVVAALAMWVAAPAALFHWKPVLVTTDAMDPNLSPGDTVLVAGPGKIVLEKGVVVAFREHGDLVARRIIAVGADGTYTTKGDSPTAVPVSLTPDRIEGVGRLVVPEIGRPFLWRATGDGASFGLWALVTLVAAGLTTVPLVRMARRRFAGRATGAKPRPADDPTPAVSAALRRLRGLAAVILVVQVSGTSTGLPGVGWVRALVVAAIIGGVNLLSLRAGRRPHSRLAFAVGIVELAVDSAITLFIVTELRPISDSIMWALLVVPVLEGALRHRLRGAVLTWAAVGALYMVREIGPVTGPGGGVVQAAFLAQIQDLVQRVGVVLLVAVPGAYLSEQLVGAIAGQRRAKLVATTRGHLLERVVDAGRRINQLGGEVVTELTRAAAELGFEAVDVCRWDEREGWTVAAAAGDIALPDPGGADGAADAAWNDGASAVLTRRDVTVVATPIRGVDNAVAVLRAGMRSQASRAQVECLELLAGQAGVALRNGTLLGQLQDAHQRLEHQAYHDALSGLPNREFFSQRLTSSLRDAGPGKRVAVMFLDLDRFKAVNDTLGHEVGDDLLVAVAGRLQRAVRSGTLVARIGGDEFTVLMPDLDKETRAEKLAERICESLSAPFKLGRNEVAISTSVGIALSEGTTVGAGELMRRADVAMYKAKSRGPANWQFWSSELDGATVERMQMESELRRAVERDELALVFQPIGSVRQGRVTGVEALVRWRHPERGLVGPDDFIPLAEDSGLINEVGHWVLEQACAQGQKWTERFPGRRLSMAVNVSPRQLTRPGFVAELKEVLASTGFNPKRLTLEMTERVLAGEESLEQLKAVRALGVRLAIDDFGQGQASMSYLKRFKIDILKIDKSFLHGSSDNRNLAILKSMITLARDLGIQVVAEGVETAEQAEQLRDLECDMMQGYWFHMPMGEPEVTELLVTRGRPHPSARKKKAATVTA